MSDFASDLADALWTCMEARREKQDAFEASYDGYRWERMSHSYWDAIESADKQLADVLSRFQPNPFAGLVTLD